MKYSKLKNIAGLFIALTVTGGLVTAQGRNNSKGFKSQESYCVNAGINLSGAQQVQISTLRMNHQKTMYSLREKRQATTNAVEKSEIRTEMLKTVEAHQNSVKMLLNTQQKAKYERLHAKNGNGQAKSSGNRSVCAKKRGQGNCKGKGNGTGQGNRNNCGLNS